MSENPIVSLHGVGKTYAAPGKGDPQPVLINIDLIIKAAQSLAIVGPSGSGKSTLLNIMGALDRPTEGSVEVNGQDLVRLSEPKLAEFRNQQVGFVFQDHHLLPPCTVLENVMIPTLAAKVEAVDGEKTLDRARRLLSEMGMEHRLTHRPAELSGGEKQRVALVRALINKPSLLLADEPTGALDHASADRLMRLLGELNRKENLTLVVATHARDLAFRMDRVIALRDGQLQDAVERDLS